MSHYAVAVFADDADFVGKLEPYDENNESEFVFEPVDYQDIVDAFEKFKEKNPKWTLDMYIEGYGYIQENGQYGYRHNPHGYWDWYSLDGKDYIFDLKEGIDEPEDGFDYRKNDYDWYPDNADDMIEAETFWDRFIDGETDDDYPSLFSREYYRDRYKTKEQYVKEMSRTVPWAFITPDGVWHAPGKVGMFATSDETAEDWERYVAEWDEFIRSDANPFVNLVDCHI